MKTAKCFLIAFIAFMAFKGTFTFAQQQQVVTGVVAQADYDKLKEELEKAKNEIIELRMGIKDAATNQEKADLKKQLEEANKKAEKLEKQVKDIEKQRAVARTAAKRKADAISLADKEVELAKVELEKEKMKSESEIRKLEITNKKELLNSQLTSEADKFSKGCLPGEDIAFCLLRAGCPKDTSPKVIKIGDNVRLECEQLIISPPVLPVISTQPNSECKCTSKYVKCLAWAGIGGAIGGGTSYGYTRYRENDFGLFDAIGTSMASAGVFYGICLAASDDCICQKN